MSERRRPIDPAEVAHAVVGDFMEAGIDAQADWDTDPDVNGNELWHLYTFHFESTFSASEVPNLIEIARARIYTFGYRGLTSVRVQGVIGEKQNQVGIGEKTLTFTRNFNDAFSSVGHRLKELKTRGSVRNEITAIVIHCRAPQWMERQRRRGNKLGKKQTQKPRRRFGKKGDRK